MRTWLQRHKKRLLGVAALACTAALSITIALIPNSFYLTYIGTGNLYLFMFVIAFVGSISTFASIPYPLILIGLVAAGGNALALGLCSAAGAILSDASTFFTARRGAAIMSDRVRHSVEYFGALVARYPRLMFPGLLAYGTFSPLSNDFAVITGALMQQRYYRILLPLAIGNILYNLTLAFYGGNLYSIVTAWL